METIGKIFVSWVLLFLLSCSGEPSKPGLEASTETPGEIETAFLKAAQEKAEKIASGAVDETQLLRRAKRFATRVQNFLDLNDNQFQKVVAVRMTFFSEARALQQRYPNDEAKIQEEMTKLAENSQKAFENILTSAQYEKWKASKEADEKLPE